MSYARLYLPALLLFWAGLLFGVSFLATPVKFQAPSLALSVGIDVGRYTFLWLNRLEWAGVALLAFLLWRGTRSLSVRTAGAAIALIVAVETWWLLPLLDERAQIVIDGGEAPPSRLHQVYIALDLAELILLLGLGFATLYLAARPKVQVTQS